MMFGQNSVGFAEILRKEGPPAVFTGSGGSTGGTSSRGSATGKGDRTFVRFQTAEQQKAVFPTAQLGKGEGAILVEMDKSRKKADLEQLLHMSTDLPGMIKEEQDKGLASYGIEKTAIESKERADRYLPAFLGSHIQVPEGFEVEPIASPTDSASPESRRSYRELSFNVLSGFQETNRNNASLGFMDLMLSISKDPEVAAAIGVDVIVGGVVRPFFNFTAKVGDEMVRTVQCTTQGLGVGTGCSTPTEFQDYWGSLMTGEGQSYSAGAIALDTIGIVAGPTIAGMGADAAAAVLKKVPEGIELVAKSVVRGAERIKIGYAAVGFADETGAILIGEGNRIASRTTAEAGLAAEAIEIAPSLKVDLTALSEDNISRLRTNPLAKTEYNDKLLGQMRIGDFHSFPLVVDNFGGLGTTSPIKGGDGIIRTHIKLDGSYKGRDGFFEWIIEPDGKTIRHRLFVEK
jgi:hypothetical protein